MSKDGMLLGEEVAGVNQILPHKHQLAWDLFLKGVANNWSPSEINMSDDVDQWKNGTLTEDENYSLKDVLGFLLEASPWLAITYYLLSRNG